MARRSAVLEGSVAATEVVQTADLVQDDAIYPRRSRDSVHVGDLVRALRAGATLPAVVADRNTRKVLDGWHRIKAAEVAQGAAAVVEVNWADCANEAEMVLEAVRLNSAHGLKLDKVDQVRAVGMLDRLGIDVKVISFTLSVPELQVQRLRLRRVEVQGGGHELLKASVLHLSGTEVTQARAGALRSAPGTHYSLLARQLADALEFGLLERDDAELVRQMGRLSRLIGEVWEVPAAE